MLQVDANAVVLEEAKRSTLVFATTSQSIHLEMAGGLSPGPHSLNSADVLEKDQLVLELSAGNVTIASHEGDVITGSFGANGPGGSIEAKRIPR